MKINLSYWVEENRLSSKGGVFKHIWEMQDFNKKDIKKYIYLYVKEILNIQAKKIPYFVAYKKHQYKGHTLNLNEIGII